MHMGPWERLQLARRKLALAVAEEDYKVAAAAKREVEGLHARLPSSLALMDALLERLEAPGGLPEEEAAAVVTQLGDLGEWAAAPVLAAALHEGEAVASAAEEALWHLFLKCARWGGWEPGAGLQGAGLSVRCRCSLCMGVALLAHSLI